MTPLDYLHALKAKLAASPIIAVVDMLEEYALSDRGYFRARLTLHNHDFLEVAEYFVLERRGCVTKRYRYQWMDASRSVLKKRWDNVEHFPALPNFPHHVHIGEESHVEPGAVLSITALLDALEDEIDKKDSQA